MSKLFLTCHYIWCSYIYSRTCYTHTNHNFMIKDCSRVYWLFHDQLVHTLLCAARLHTDSYEQLTIVFQFQRLSTHYIIFLYIPSTLLVLLGGLLFWLPPGALAERTSYSAFLFLAMVVLSAASQYGIPQVSSGRHTVWHTCVQVYYLHTRKNKLEWCWKSQYINLITGTYNKTTSIDTFPCIYTCE